MKKDLLTHFLFMTAYFLIISVVKDWFRIGVWPFWLGGILGTFLPDADYLIYVYFLRPSSKNSVQAANMISQKEVVKTWDFLTRSKDNKSDLIFHTAFFQLIFAAFTFWIVSSTGSIFALGLALAFALHLLIDQVTDLVELGGINIWFTKLNWTLDSKQEKYYVFAQVVLLLFLTFYY